MVVFVDEDNGDVDNIPSDGEGLDGDDETSDESEADSSSDVSRRTKRARTESEDGHFPRCLNLLSQTNGTLPMVFADVTGILPMVSGPLF